MKQNSHILHCYDNLVAMATVNCIFSFIVCSSFFDNLLTRLLCLDQEIQSPIFFVRLELARVVHKSEGFIFVVQTE